MPIGSSSADTRKLRADFALPFVEYTSAVLLNTVRPNSPRQSQLASNLPTVPLLRRPRLNLGLAFPMIISSPPVGAIVSPLVHPVLAASQANTCCPLSLTRRNFGPQKVPSGSPGIRRCE